jgi:hypothetical protein
LKGIICFSLRLYVVHLGVLSLDPVVEEPSASSSPSPPRVVPIPPPQPPAKTAEPIYTPYTDDPEAGYEPGIMLQTQRRMIDGMCPLASLHSPPLSLCLS